MATQPSSYWTGVPNTVCEDFGNLHLEPLKRQRVSIGGPHQCPGFTGSPIDLGVSVQKKGNEGPDYVAHFHLRV